MSTVHQYVQQYGFIPFEQKPFVAEDNVVLCAICYMPFEEVVSEDVSTEPIRFDVACQQLFAKRGCKHKPVGVFLPEGLSVLMMEMSVKKRYSEMRIVSCRNYVEAKPAKQFAAATFLLPNKTVVVVFRGTDDTIESWKEDIDMINSVGGIPSAKESLSYIKEVAEHFVGDIIICGHSKGGYIAQYAALYADSEVKSRITAVYNNDGPGFADGSYLESEAYKSLLPKYHHYIPQSSFFGMMLNHDNDYKIVKSNKTLGIVQHDLLSWQFDGDRLIFTDSLSAESRFNQAFGNELTESLNNNDLEAVDEVIQALIEQSESSRFLDLKSNAANSLKKAISVAKTIDNETKSTIKAAAKKVIIAANKTLKRKP